MSRRTEAAEQVKVVRRLRYARLLYCAIPNGLPISAAATTTLHAEGLVNGAPDLLIFTPPPLFPDARGTALEMKTPAFKPSDWKPAQQEWAKNLEALGWKVLLGKGAEDAIEKLRALGYELG
jgi:hypothetical protein